jgi:hypothetical protein
MKATNQISMSSSSFDWKFLFKLAEKMLATFVLPQHLGVAFNLIYRQLVSYGLVSVRETTSVTNICSQYLINNSHYDCCMARCEVERLEQF